MAYKCKACEDTGFTAKDADGTVYSWREVQRRGTLSNALKRWASHMPKVECTHAELKASVAPPAKKKHAKKKASRNYWGK